MSSQPKHYAAFISYSHLDHSAARWLHRAIEGYRLPRDIQHATLRADGTARRLSPVFLDREELSSSADLAASVRLALQGADFLIVICSPNAARSRWVDEEVRTFKELGRAANILCLIVAGDPRLGAGAADDCFPPALRFEVSDGRVTDQAAAEPLAADIRAGVRAKRDAKLRIIAGLLRLPLDELRRREQVRRHRRLTLLASASAVGCVVLAGLALLAWRARNEAERQRQIAVQKSLTEVSDPSEARGNSVTAREILDRGARQIATGLQNEPLVRAELASTLGRVYYGLGLYGPASELLLRARSVGGQEPRTMAAQSITLADIAWARGEYPRAESLYVQADRQLDRAGMADPSLRARVLIGLGDTASMHEHFSEARVFFDEALTIAKMRNADPDLMARALESMANTDVDSGRLAEAGGLYKKALEARVRASGESHPKVLDILNNLGAMAYFKGDSQTAESYWLRLLDIDRRILGPHHPELAVTLNNLARLRVEQRRFGEAVPMLTEARTIQHAQRNENQEDLIFALNNLALAYFGSRKYHDAEPLFMEALHAAQTGKHRLEGPILTDLADLECRTGRFDASLKRLDVARSIVAARYPDDPWRVAHVDNVRAGCLTGLKRYAEAEKFIETSTPIMLAKWPPATLYGHDTLDRAIRLYSRTQDSAKLAHYRQLSNKK
jgi:tetratricopeptide (TPR) repeat protein